MAEMTEEFLKELSDDADESTETADKEEDADSTEDSEDSEELEYSEDEDEDEDEEEEEATDDDDESNESEEGEAEEEEDEWGDDGEEDSDDTELTDEQLIKRFNLNAQQLDNLKSFGEAVLDPQYAPEALKKLDKIVKEGTGKSVAEHLGLDEGDFGHWPDEGELDKEALRKQIRDEVLAEIGPDLEESRASREQRAKVDKAKAVVNREGKRVHKTFKRTEAGFSVSKEMALNAAMKYPDLPLEDAVALTFRGDIKKHHVGLKAKARKRKRAPEMLEKSSGGGKKVVAPEDYGFAKALNDD